MRQGSTKRIALASLFRVSALIIQILASSKETLCSSIETIAFITPRIRVRPYLLPPSLLSPSPSPHSITAVKASSLQEGGDVDESFLLSQALNPNKKRDDHDSNNYNYNNNNDPFLSLLNNNNNHNYNSQHQSMGSSSSSPKPWYENLPSNQSLPFDCTGCGKCCQTKGEVYLNPNETKNAAKVLHVSVDEFKSKYTSREIVYKSRDDESWTVLKQKKDDNGIEGCVFLDGETKMCSIYDARPLQCSTYPFWPRIMESIDSWNEEVVTTHNTNNDHYDSHNNGQDDSSNKIERIWTHEIGGCEGMKEIKIVEDHKKKLILAQEKDDNDNGYDDDTQSGVSVQDGMDRLETYVRYKRSFPG